MSAEWSSKIPDGDAVEKFSKQQKGARRKIVSVTNDAALLVIRLLIGKSLDIIEKLDAWFYLRNTTSKRKKIKDILSLHFQKMESDIPKHIDKMTMLLEKLSRMKNHLWIAGSRETPQTYRDTGDRTYCWRY